MAIVFGLIIVIQFPGVQTHIADKMLKSFESNIDGKITFDKISLRPFDAIVLNNITITDNSPYHDSSRTVSVDTLFSAENLSATFNLKSLIYRKGLHIGKARIKNGSMNLVIEPEEKSKTILNLSRIFNLKEYSDSTKNNNDIFHISRISLDNFRFKLVNFNKTDNLPKEGIDWNDLDIKIHRLRGHDLNMKGAVMQGISDELSFSEKSGYKALNVTGSAKVGNGKTIIKDVTIKDLWSDISAPSILFTYKDTRSWADFINAVRMNIKLNKSKLNLKSIGYFVPELQRMSMQAEVSARFEGYVNDFNIKDINLKTLDNNVSGKINCSIKGLPDIRKMMTDITIKDFNFSLAGLEKFLQGWIPETKIPIGSYSPDQTFGFNGKISGPLNKLIVKCEADSDAGGFDVDLDISNLTDSEKSILIGGEIATKSLDLGKILNNKALGGCTMHTAMNASIDKKSKIIKIDSLIVDKFNALGYEYKNIAAIGVYENETFNGKIVCSDPNLNFIFQGIFTPSAKTKNAIYHFYANLGYADLNALKIDKKSISRLSFQTSADFKVIDGKEILGNIDVRDLVLEDAHGVHDIGAVSISSHLNDNVNRIRLNSSFADGSYIGSGFINTFIQDLIAITAMKEMPALSKGDTSGVSGNSYKLALNLHNSKDILSFIVPGLYVSDSTAINIEINESGTLNGGIKSQRLAYMDKYIKGLNLNINNKNDELSGELISDEIRFAPATMKNSRLLIFANDNNIGAGFSYDNETEKVNSGEIYLRGKLLRDNKNSLALKAEILPSNIYINSEPWSIGNSEIYIDSRSVKINDLLVKNNQQFIRIEGGYSTLEKDKLNIDLDKFDISMLNAFFNKDYNLSGRLSGTAALTSPPGSGISLQMNVRSDSTYFADEKIGTLEAKCLSADSGKSFDIALKNDIDGKKTIEGSAIFIPKNKKLKGNLQLDSLNIGYAAPFLKDIFHLIQGNISGNISFNGPLEKLNLDTEGLAISNGRLGVDFTKVIYNIDGKADIDSKGVYFNNIAFSDRFGAKGKVKGSIRWNYFKNMLFDTHITCKEMEVINIAEGENPAFYGNVFATGALNITGPSRSILLEVDAKTAKESSFKVPMSNTSSYVNSSHLLTFKNPESTLMIDPYEEILSRFKKTIESKSDLGVRLHLGISPETEIQIEIDKESGNILTAMGSGVIDIDVKPANNVFNLNGDYNITTGSYHFDALGLVRRDFSIQEGSIVKFNGDIMDSELDIKALYKTKASIGILIADTTSTARRNVECILSLRNKLSAPKISFDIEIPDLDPSTKALVENALSTEDKVQKQFLSLLVSNSFIPDERSGIVNNSRMLNTTVAEIMSNQLNNILQTLNIPVDLGLDYQNSHGSDIFDVAISTALFNDMVIVNGTIGNRLYRTSNSNNEIVGDLDIEIKLDKPGSLRLSLFSHSADQYTSYLDNSQRNGIGLTYQKEFNTFKDFFKSLFKSKKRRKEEEEAKEMTGKSEEKVKISIEESINNGK